jgi:hypothetical protein
MPVSQHDSGQVAVSREFVITCGKRNARESDSKVVMASVTSYMCQCAVSKADEMRKAGDEAVEDA